MSEPEHDEDVPEVTAQAGLAAAQAAVQPEPDPEPENPEG